MCRKAVLYVVAITLFMWCLSVPQAARAATLTVGQKSAACPKPLYLTIQSAVNAASSGDTIHVCAGTYPEQVVITKSLNLSGDNGALIEPVNRRSEQHEFHVRPPVDRGDRPGTGHDRRDDSECHRGWKREWHQRVFAGPDRDFLPERVGRAETT